MGHFFLDKEKSNNLIERKNKLDLFFGNYIKKINAALKSCVENKIIFPEDVLNHITFYYYDKYDEGKNWDVDLTYYDIRSAFPSMLKLILGPNDEFVLKMDRIKDKRKKLIFLSTHVREYFDDDSVLSKLNEAAKTLILMKSLLEAIKNNRSVKVIELKKDGIIVKFKQSNNGAFRKINMMILLNVVRVISDIILFTTKNIKLYVRVERTSFVCYDSKDVEVKGIFSSYFNDNQLFKSFLEKLLLDLDLDEAVKMAYLLSELINPDNIYKKKHFDFLSNLIGYNNLKKLITTGDYSRLFGVIFPELFRSVQKVKIRKI